MTKDKKPTAAARLGLNPRCAVLTGVAVAALILAITAGAAALYGATAVLAFIAGTTWDREISCDTCHTSLEER